MSVIGRFLQAVENKDEDTLNELVHDDYKFIPHIKGVEFGKRDMVSICMSDSFTRNESRIVYENDEIAIDHAFVTFANGSTPEAVISVHQISEGKIMSTETGATPLDEGYSLVGSDE